MRYLVPALIALSSAAFGQVPDVRTKVDLTISYRTGDHIPSELKMYDPLGKTSTLGLTFYLEPGFRAFIAERLQRIENDPDRDPFDEYYVEDEGIWRVGRQYLPFGSGNILRESVVAARADTNLIIERLPISVAVCDGGNGLPQGFVGRLGNQFGLSFATGHNFGVSGTALGLVRRLENSPGRNRGWRQALGVDGVRKSGIFSSRFEVVALSNSQDTSVKDIQIYDLSFSSQPSKYQLFTVGFTRRMPDRLDIFRLLGSYYISKNVTLDPMVRYAEGKLFDATVSVRVRF